MSEFNHYLYQSDRLIAGFELQPDARDMLKMLKSKYPDLKFEIKTTKD